MSFQIGQGYQVHYCFSMVLVVASLIWSQFDFNRYGLVLLPQLSPRIQT